MGGEFKKALSCAAAFIGAVVGAGMASGAEIVIYFTSMGKFALLAIVLAVILICLVYSLIASYAACAFFCFQEQGACCTQVL